MVYQFKEMPKNIVIIDDDKADLSAPDDLISSESAMSYERVLPSPDMLLQATKVAPSKKPNILRGGNRANVVQAPVATSSKTATGGGTAVPAGVPRIVTVSAAADGNQTQQSHTTLISSTAGPRLDAFSFSLRHFVLAGGTFASLPRQCVLSLTSHPQNSASGDAGACCHDYIAGSEDLHSCSAAANRNIRDGQPSGPAHQRFSDGRCHCCCC